MILGTGNQTRSTRVHSAGFSLLEMIISLGLISVIVGFFTIHFTFTDDSEQLEQFQYQVERLVMKTARSSNAFGEDRVISISKTMISSGGSQLPVPPEIKLLLKRSGETEFRRPEDVEWLFYPGGLVEPLTLRLEGESSFLMMTFDPVTARRVIE